MKCNDCAFYRVCDAGKEPTNNDILDSNIERVCPQFLQDEEDYIARELVDLMVKKRSGQVIELPVPIGTTIYIIDSYVGGPHIYAATVDSSDSIDWIRYLCRKWGETVFATKEEAEAKLKELKNDCS